MKISLNWLRKFVDIKVPDDELVRLIGSRLVEVEEVVDEMLAIRTEIESWRSKKESREANAKYNEMLNSRSFEE